MRWRRTFFTIAIGQAVSLIGSSAVQFAMIWWLSVETASPIILSLAGLASFLPSFIFSPFAGVWTDRLRRKNVVIAADIFMGLVALAYAVWFFIEVPPLWSVFTVLFLRGIGGAFHAPALQSLIPSFVPQSELMRANGWTQFMESGAFMLGPVLGGLMYGVLPMPVILMSDFLGAAAASTTVAFSGVKEPEVETHAAPNFLSELREGVNVFRENRTLLALLAATFVCMVCFMPLSSLYPLMTSDYFNLNAFFASIIELLFALGMMGVSLIMSIKAVKHNKLFIVHVGLWGMGVTSFLCGLLPASFLGYWLFALLCMAMGACSNLYGIPVLTYLQETVPSERMGRAFSLWGMTLSAAMPLGLIIAGPVAEKFGVKSWFLTTGLVVIAATTVNYHRLKRHSNNSK